MHSLASWSSACEPHVCKEFTGAPADARLLPGQILFLTCTLIADVCVDILPQEFMTEIRRHRKLVKSKMLLSKCYSSVYANKKRVLHILPMTAQTIAIISCGVKVSVSLVACHRV